MPLKTEGESTAMSVLESVELQSLIGATHMGLNPRKMGIPVPEEKPNRQSQDGTNVQLSLPC